MALAGLSGRIEVRLGDGFAPIETGQVQSASLTGMGARTILGILKRAAALPQHLVLQPNDAPELLRTWALENGYHLKDEALAQGFCTYAVLSFARGREEDPAYAGLPRDLAVTWGPHLLRRHDEMLIHELRRQERRLSKVASFQRPQVRRDLDSVQRALALLDHQKAGPSLS